MRKEVLLMVAVLSGAAGASADACFAVHVTLNGKAMASPQAVTFVMKDGAILRNDRAVPR